MQRECALARHLTRKSGRTTCQWQRNADSDAVCRLGCPARRSVGVTSWAEGPRRAVSPRILKWSPVTIAAAGDRRTGHRGAGRASWSQVVPAQAARVERLVPTQTDAGTRVGTTMMRRQRLRPAPGPRTHRSLACSESLL
jgi:hypothetical protein